MIGALLRTVVILVILVAGAAFFLGYRWGQPPAQVSVPSSDVTGTAGTATPPLEIDEARARRAGAEVGEKVAEGVNEAQRAVADASLTAKIKSKMALDDLVEARHIDVDTKGSVVTLSGVVHSGTERDRALQLARETAGVASVINRLQVTSAP